ncbi:ribonuclease E activity regulator RraA [Rothia sp. AR01]|uniref:4-hydroxy-4-methyl-2-oxoglutarate aldolase n=2 Tax=Rothia santali TaxID=2949643 RepID=A0A9X2HCG6_9MICC|nr:ribonuclease E activity regulator RraA [Rothia santali]MCP3425585.1 ribonuclease E activity regulator RraA [Rothia santali]
MTTIHTSDVYDQRGDECLAVTESFANLGGRRQFSGPVRTVRCFEDNGLLKGIMEEPGEGAVLVVDAGGTLRCAMLGGNMALRFSQNGWAGVIVYGAVRDRHELVGIDLGVQALGSNPRRSGKAGSGERDVVLTFADTTFRPGAMVYADDDGILVER